MNTQTYHRQDLRSFLESYEAEHPNDVLRISEPVDLDYDATAIAFEFERRGSPVIILENVKGSEFPVLMNLYGARRRFAAALGVAEEELVGKWANIDATPVPPTLVDTGPILDVVHTGDAVDLAKLPIMRHFIEDGGAYVTNAMYVAKDPETGVRNASFQSVAKKWSHAFWY